MLLEGIVSMQKCYMYAAGFCSSSSASCIIHRSSNCWDFCHPHPTSHKFYAVSTGSLYDSVSFSRLLLMCENVSCPHWFQLLKPVNELLFSLFFYGMPFTDWQGSKEEATAPTRSAVSSQESDSCNRCVIINVLMPHKCLQCSTITQQRADITLAPW